MVFRKKPNITLHGKERELRVESEYWRLKSEEKKDTEGRKGKK